MSTSNDNLTATVEHVTLTNRRKLRVGKRDAAHWIVFNNQDIPVSLSGQILYKGMVKTTKKMPVVQALGKDAVITVTSYIKIKSCK